MSTSLPRMAPLRDFVVAMTHLVDQRLDAAELLRRGRPLLAALLAQDDWLPEASAQADPERYQQHLLHCDPLERFCVVSFVWGPGQRTPVHDHQVWGLVGVLRGAESSQRYRLVQDELQPLGGEEHSRPGDISEVSPDTVDIHYVANALPDQVSVSIHVYGANIGAVARHAQSSASGKWVPFVSGYSSAPLPNLWDRSEAVRAALAG